MSLSLRPSLNWLLVFVPVSVALDHFCGDAVSPPVLFFAAALAIVPITRIIVRATTQLSILECPRVRTDLRTCV